ncbi:MAG: ATP-binding protein, partial [Candidatus Pacebacteria bacterium]|nr:ATP-binding protein [Candidatus Paceibacterota bacterium]
MAKEAKEKRDTYGAEAITVLEGLEPVRKRPGMYIGTTGPEGLHHLIWEIFDNSRDEAMGGHCNRIEVALLPDGYVRVVDNGRGIPVDIHSKTKVSALETIMTTLHAGGKFGGEGYKVSGGLHGVGASVVNALSIHTKVNVHKEGLVYTQDYKIGKPQYKVKPVGKTKNHGSVTLFKADAEIFKEGIEYDWTKIYTHLRQQAYLVKALEINVLDARNLGGDEKTKNNKVKALEKALADEETMYLKDEGIDMPSMTFFFEGGLRSLVAFYNQSQKPLHKNIFYVEKEFKAAGTGNESKDVNVEVALQYVDDINPKIVAFANNTYN